MDTFLAIMSGALEMLGAVTSWGGALFFAVVASRYVFTGCEVWMVIFTYCRYVFVLD